MCGQFHGHHTRCNTLMPRMARQTIKPLGIDLDDAHFVCGGQLQELLRAAVVARGVEVNLAHAIRSGTQASGNGVKAVEDALICHVARRGDGALL